jgi:manganese transport protein
MPLTDSYRINNEAIQDPPSSIVGGLKFLGPGFILSASIVGSGELIATTVLGAKAGYAALWIIIVSCLAKVAVQLEFGRHAKDMPAMQVYPMVRLRGKNVRTVGSM